MIRKLDWFFVVACVVIGAGFVAVAAQEKPKQEQAAPTLSKDDTQRVIIAAQSVEIARLKAQAAAAEWQTQKAALDAVVESLKVPGYDLTQGEDGQLKYVKKSEATKGGK